MRWSPPLPICLEPRKQSWSKHWLTKLTLSFRNYDKTKCLKVKTRRIWCGTWWSRWTWGQLLALTSSRLSYPWVHNSWQKPWPEMPRPKTKPTTCICDPIKGSLSFRLEFFKTRLPQFWCHHIANHLTPFFATLTTPRWQQDKIGLHFATLPPLLVHQRDKKWPTCTQQHILFVTIFLWTYHGWVRHLPV